VGKDYKPLTNIDIPTHICVCWEMNTHMRTLDYFINDEHIKDHFMNVPEDCISEFDILYLFILFIDMKIL
jgi:hypothetical protein